MMHSFKLLKPLFIVPVTLSLMACGTLADGQSHLVTMKTPGAQNAKCIIENQDFKSVAFSGETIRIMKSDKDLVVRCEAPGNRDKAILVQRELNGWSILNISNGLVPGVAYDYLSRGLFDYPDVLTVDFTGVPTKPAEAPKYASDDLRNGNHKGRPVYMGPAEIVTADDYYDVPQRLEKRTASYNDFSPSSGEISGVNSYVAPSANNTPSNIGGAYTSRPRVSYDPTEEDK